MTWLLRDLIEKLKREDEVFLVELLGLTSEQLVEAFIDVIEDKYDQLVKEIED